jgi:hypothetical protein
LENATVADLGLVDEGVFTRPLIRGAKDVPLAAGRVGADTTLQFSLDGGAPIPVTLYADDTGANTTVLSLVNDLNQALWVPIVKTGILPSLTPAGPLSFSVGLNGGPLTLVTVSAAALTGNATLSDLVKDINDALKALGLGKHVIAKPSGASEAPRSTPSYSAPTPASPSSSPPTTSLTRTPSKSRWRQRTRPLTCGWKTWWRI